MTAKKYFSRVYILQSLRKGDLKTGTNLEDLLQFLRFKVPQLSCRLFEIADKASFLLRLQDIEKDVLIEKQYPIIHVDVHGDENGIKVSSGEVITWNELQPILMSINIACCNNLFVVLAVCKGGNLLKVCYPPRRATVWGLIGSFQNFEAQDADVSFQAFYKELLTSFDVNMALDQLNNAFPKMQPRYSFTTCMSMFIETFKKYHAEYCVGKRKKERIEVLITKVMNAQYIQGGRSVTEVRNQAKSLSKKGKDDFEKQKERFFMIDLCPNNRERFLDLRYIDCVSHSESL
ncbi:MAG: hypothetical protein HQK96_13155 [Nitrospirae bacterium]|nr:hypothetical protein [Nitrospirota bacterium]